LESQQVGDHFDEQGGIQALIGNLHDQYLQELELRGYSPHTCRCYVGCVRAFVSYFLAGIFLGQQMGQKPLPM